MAFNALVDINTEQATVTIPLRNNEIEDYDKIKKLGIIQVINPVGLDNILHNKSSSI